MPSKNRIKQYGVGCYYHIYNRGVNKRKIFLDEEDYAVFLNLLKRYLDATPQKDKKGRMYTNLYGQLELLAFCLMPNHFHLFVYQNETSAVTYLMAGVCTAYSRYFNKKHKRVGHLFQDCFKASLVIEDSYFAHVSRYIHLNPADYMSWQFSSLPYYLGKKRAKWVMSGKVMEDFKNTKDYLQFLNDYEDQKKIMSELKYELANL